jgi:hypothetical protein
MMKINIINLVVAALTVPAFTQELPTTGTIESRLGKLKIDHGFPTQDTVKKLYDDLDFQRASIPCWVSPLALVRGHSRVSLLILALMTR